MGLAALQFNAQTQRNSPPPFAAFDFTQAAQNATRDASRLWSLRKFQDDIDAKKRKDREDSNEFWSLAVIIEALDHHPEQIFVMLDDGSELNVRQIKALGRALNCDVGTLPALARFINDLAHDGFNFADDLKPALDHILDLV